MPYLHWEYEEARQKMRVVIKDIVSKDSEPLSSEVGDNETPADEKLLRKHLLTLRPVHTRRTLDESFYWTLKDTQFRDRDQLISRVTRMNDNKSQILMVDQLWLWILDGNVVITSFPRNWGHAKSNMSSVQRRMQDCFSAKLDLYNVYDMATLIMDQCSRAFFDRLSPGDTRPQMLDIFTEAIGNTTARSTIAFTRFSELLLPQDDENVLEKLLNVEIEFKLLLEIRDILEELDRMKKVFSEQYTVVQDFFTHIKKLEGDNENFSLSTHEKVAQLVKGVIRRKAELQELTEAGIRTIDGLKQLLDLKQKHASIRAIHETQKAGRRTEESNKILKAMQRLAEQANIQTEQGADQNRSVLIFTTITVVFLPLGFFSSVFGMNATEFGQGTVHIWKQLLIMLILSIFIVGGSLLLAFNAQLWRFFSRKRGKVSVTASVAEVANTHDEETAAGAMKRTTI